MKVVVVVLLGILVFAIVGTLLHFMAKNFFESAEEAVWGKKNSGRRLEK